MKRIKQDYTRCRKAYSAPYLSEEMAPSAYTDLFCIDTLSQVNDLLRSTRVCIVNGTKGKDVFTCVSS